MKQWKDFEPFVALNVPGCAPLAIREALREAVDIFCEKTHVWQVECAPLGVFPNVADYEFPIDLDQRVVTVMSVKYKDVPLQAVTTDDLDAAMPNWTAAGTGATAMMFRVFLDDSAQFIRLFPTPTEAVSASLRIRVAVKPSSSAENIPDFFYEDWRRALASGAISRLCAVPGKDYSNPDLAVFHERLFQMGMGKAMNRQASGMARIGLRVRPRRFGT
jgi:hypothetical protein